MKHLIKKILKEYDEEKLSSDSWEDIWFKLRKIDKSFGVPDDDIFTFGGLFFYYSPKTGDLFLPPQKLSDWRDDLERAAEILENYVYRLESIFNSSDMGLKLEVGEGFSMRIYKDNN